MWPVASHCEDVVITLAVTFLVQRIAYVTDALYHYRDNPTSITNTNDPGSLCRRVSNFIRNNEVIEQFYERMGISEKYQHGIMVNRVFAKNELLLLPDKKERRRLWRDTYRELNKVLFVGNRYYKSTYREKVWVVALLLGLFPKYKRVLLSKRLRPAVIWRTGLSKRY